MSAKPREAASRSPRDRLRTRLRRLQSLRASDGIDVDTKVRNALSRIHHEGRQPDHVRIRRGFVHRSEPAPGLVSDRRLPPREQRPPLARLISPRGLALPMELTALFVAQTVRNRRQGHPTFTLPIEARRSDQIGWADLVAAVAEHDPASERAVTRSDNRLRQLKTALDTLAKPELGLVTLPRAGAARTKYEDFQLRDENGTRDVGPAVDYVVPKSTEPVVTVPVAFFLNGWIHALTDSEIAAWLMFRSLNALDTPEQDRPGVHLSGEHRLRYYGLSKDTWESHRTLSLFGLLHVEAAEGRRVDGTVEDYDPRSAPQRHRFWVTDEALQQPALPAVLAGVATAIEDW